MTSRWWFVGLPTQNGKQHAVEICKLALDLMIHLGKQELPHMPGNKFRLRIGCHTGNNFNTTPLNEIHPPSPTQSKPTQPNLIKSYQIQFNIDYIQLTTNTTRRDRLHRRSLVSINTLQWRHNERDGFSNHRRLDCLLTRLFRRR